jgi:hypothetical protein
VLRRGEGYTPSVHFFEREMRVKNRNELEIWTTFVANTNRPATLSFGGNTRLAYTLRTAK